MGLLNAVKKICLAPLHEDSKFNNYQNILATRVRLTSAIDPFCLIPRDKITVAILGHL